HFTMSRFGVMKHLQLLESANLVVVRRHGRKRWNHLNAIPIRRIYQRWVGKYAEYWSSSLLNLKTLTEQGQQYMSNHTYNFDIAQEVVINAPRAAVWKALTTDIHKWWA